MNNIVGLAVFALGIVLLIFGFNESQPVATELARSLDTSRESIWMIAGGAAAVVAGLFLAIRSRKA